MVTAASFAVHFVILGTNYSFGVFFAALLADPTMLSADSRAQGAWVGSIAVACMLGGGMVAGSLVQRVGARATSGIGGIVVGAGLLGSSFAPSVGVLYASFGLVVGSGMALSFVPAVIVIGQYFTLRRSLATGLAVSGSGIGTFAFAAMNERMISEVRPARRKDWAARLRVCYPSFTVL